ncbi:cation-translocating P-type ATPase [Bdellovibrio sp.]|uniref:cation-translocating P-type ATPase n=1 Tax=Bdellovibrio sp. TaxID=28201 RepID=UPI0039E2D6AB
MRKKISFENLKDIQRSQKGLSGDEVERQRRHFGLNEIVEVAGNPWIELAQETLKDPMIWFLVGIGSIFFLVGEPSEGLVLFVAILPLLFMDAILHRRTQASIRSLKSQLASQVLVIRQGVEQTLPSQELVPGDLVRISSGEYLPADGFFEQTDGLQVDESLLTGEAFPITKGPLAFQDSWLNSKDEVLVEAQQLGHAGTRVLTGHGFLRILFTGRQTAYGEIVDSVGRLPHERTPLQKAITKLVQVLVYSAAVFCLLLAAVRIYQGYGWLDALLSAATLAVAAIPEEFPVVFTFFLGVGVYRLATKHALVRRAVSVENIGRVTQICTDKTGTITIGQLKLVHLDVAPSESEENLLWVASQASDRVGMDPVDQAINERAQEKAIPHLQRLRVFPFTEDRKREAAFVKNSQGQDICCLKGAPEMVLSMSKLSIEERAQWLEKTSRWAQDGHKVLACAQRTLTSQDLTQEPQEDFIFCGLLAFEDPPRKEVAAAISYCQKNGIRVLMITGDHRETALAIGKDIGLGQGSPVVVSAEDEAEKFAESWLADHPDFLKGLDIVARCNPLQKLRIVSALRHSGELVAVTGDGVNDVPALKAADIGIAMGERGTRSAKEVASIILMDDNFSTIVNAIREGRQLFLSLKKSFEYLLLIHIPLVLTAALIPLMGYPLLYLPVHVVWLELLIHPSALFAFQQKSSDKQKDRLQIHERSKNLFFFSRREGWWLSILGLVFTGVLTLSYVSSFSESGDATHARAKALALLTLWSAMIVAALTGLREIASRLIFTGTVLSAVLIIQIPWFSKLLHLSGLHGEDWINVVGILGVFFVILQLRRPKRKAST